jgi:hypothetical protein
MIPNVVAPCAYSTRQLHEPTSAVTIDQGPIDHRRPILHSIPHSSRINKSIKNTKHCKFVKCDIGNDIKNDKHANKKETQSQRRNRRFTVLQRHIIIIMDSVFDATNSDVDRDKTNFRSS